VKVLLTGASGQLGQALIASCPAGMELMALRRKDLDLADTEACRRVVAQHRPAWVLNAGAYTAVDRAESEPELAHAVNAAAPMAFAEVLADQGGRLLQISTDFVFSGKQGSPYRPDQTPEPLGVYGASKAAGEAAALRLPGALVLRTGWVYGPVGSNFCRTMLRLMGEREQLGVVADQVGCPTSTITLAEACWRATRVEGSRFLHWSDAGAASWYDFAVAIAELSQALGLLASPARIQPITTADYPTPARRPGYSLLDCTATRALLDLEPVHWRSALTQVLRRIASLEASPSR
jgi:dTDP-4-dehydrorhamnose reductase